MFVRGTREDFESWAAAGNTEWSYDKVLPYYRMLETDLDFQNEYHGSSGPIAVGRVMRPSWSESDHAFEDACVALGHPASDDQNHPDATGVGPVPRIRSNGTRISTAIAFLAAARGRPNLTIIPDARARRIRIQDRRATAVEIQNGHGPATVEGDEIVLCAGAIGTPHILLLSGIGPAEQLRQNGIAVLADLPGVGRDLRDHPGVRVVWERGPGDLRNGPLYLRFTAAGSALKSDCRIVAPERSGDGLAASMVGIYLAAGRGEVRLRSADPEVAPMVDLRYLDEESDRRRMRDTVLFAIELAGQPALRRFLGQVADPGEAERATSRDLDRWIERTVRTAHHLSSTAKMGPATDRTAVVDQFGRMHGIEGLRVADASIMPDCVRHNTNKTSMMIGARAADLIRMPN
jgi:choline dehydrogenase